MEGQEGTTEATLPSAPINGNTNTSTVSTPQAKAMQEIMDVIGEEAKPEPEQPKEEKKEPEIKVEAETEGETKPEPKEQVTQLEFVLPDGTKTALPDDAKIVVKVNKVEEEVTLADLKRNYQGKLPLDRFHQQSAEERKKLDQDRLAFLAEKKRFETNRTTEDEFVTDLYKTMTEGKDPAGALMKLCKRYRKDPGAVMAQIIDQSLATAEHVGKLTQEQLEVYLQRLSLSQEKALHEEDTKLSESEKKQQGELKELQGHINSECSKHKITQEEYTASENLLRSLVGAGKVDLRSQPAKAIADTIIGHVLQYQRPQMRLRTITAKVDSKLSENVKFIDRLHRQVSDSANIILPEFTDSAIEEIVRGYAGKPAPQASQTQPTEASSTGGSAKAAPGTIPQKKEEARPTVEEDDLDPLSINDIVRSYKR